MGVSQNGGTQQLLVFLLKLTILGCFWGTTIFGNTQIPFSAQADLCGAVDVDPTIRSLLGPVPAYLCVRDLRGSAQFLDLEHYSSRILKRYRNITTCR